GPHVAFANDAPGANGRPSGHPECLAAFGDDPMRDADWLVFRNDRRQRGHICLPQSGKLDESFRHRKAPFVCTIKRMANDPCQAAHERGRSLNASTPSTHATCQPELSNTASICTRAPGIDRPDG